MEQRHRVENKPHQRPGDTLPVCPRRRLRRLCQVLCLALMHAFIPKVAAGQKSSAGEYEVKAAMLYNLTRFVEWPPSAYPDSQAPTVLCILGRDPFGASLTSIVSKAIVNSRPLKIRHLQDDDSTRACHVLYISSSERKSIVRIFSSLKGFNVLTVGEMAQFAAHGGMIQFSLDEKQVRFEINLDAVLRADLKISSRLLVLARIVRNEGKDASKHSTLIGPQELMLANSRLPAGNGEHGQNSSLTTLAFLEAQRSILP